MSNRRRFLKQVSAAGILSVLPGNIFPRQHAFFYQNQDSHDEMIWACLLHISMNMWKAKYPVLPFDDSLWNDALAKMVEVGMNMVVMDLGDAIEYKSHPEIAVKNAWSADRLYEEMAGLCQAQA